MKEIPLTHFIQWEKIPENKVDTIMGKLSSIGVRNIVLHPQWADIDQGNGDYLKIIHGKMKTFGISSPACHGLWGPKFDLNCPDENRRKQIVSTHCLFLKHIAEMGCLTYTLHLGTRYPEYTAQYLREQTLKSLDNLLSEAEHSGIKIAMENMVFYDNSSELVSLVLEFNHPLLGLCFDTGHAHIHEGVKTAIENMEPYLFTCHLHDNDGHSDQHFPPGYGSIDWEFLIPTLKSCPNILNVETEAGFSKDLSLEKIWNIFQKIWNIKELESTEFLSLNLQYFCQLS